MEVGASTEQNSTVGTNGRSVELRARGSNGQSSRSIRRQTWNREDVSVLKIYRHSEQNMVVSLFLLILSLKKRACVCFNLPVTEHLNLPLEGAPFMPDQH